MLDLTTPTAYILTWLKAPEVAYLRNPVAEYGRYAIASTDESGRQECLAAMHATIHHPWKYPDDPAHQAASEHTRQLHDALTFDDLEAVDWMEVAEDLTAADLEGVVGHA
ncbi:hypothetical protein AB0392_37850 [Nonomuraea angiospora]|uniref:hypothetical protein n=1 Tax=Nonomuraea angiospora TaxID=46172 RepID=UPI00345070F8